MVRAMKYSDTVIPKEYACAECGAHGVRLWRGYNEMSPRLLCCGCAEKKEGKKLEPPCDQIGWQVPAVPTEAGGAYWWGYSAVPDAGVAWWKRLPLELAPD